MGNDTFRQDVVIKINNEGIFIANSILAKHDENYMPPEVQDTLKKDFGDK